MGGVNWKLWEGEASHRSEAEKWVGQKLGKYRLVEPLGDGGLAYVYLGEHVRSEKRAAVKVLRKDKVSKR